MIKCGWLNAKRQGDKKHGNAIHHAGARLHRAWRRCRLPRPGPGPLDRRPHRDTYGPLPGVPGKPAVVRHQCAGHTGGGGRGQRRNSGIRHHHRWRDRGLYCREASGAFHRRPARHRYRKDVGPDVLCDPLLWPQRRRDQRDFRRRPGLMGPAGQGSQGTGAPTARGGGAR